MTTIYFTLLLGPPTETPGGNSLYLKANIEEEYVFHDKSTCFVPRVVVSINQSISRKVDYMRHLYGAVDLADGFIPDTAPASPLAMWLTGLPGTYGEEIAKSVGGRDFFIGKHERACIPDEFAIPLISNRRYGPWNSEACNTTNNMGKIDYRQDERFSPWNWGSESALNIAAQTEVAAIPICKKCDELGSVSIIGFPKDELDADIPLTIGNELNVSTATANYNLYENRDGTILSTIPLMNFDCPPNGGIPGDVNFLVSHLQVPILSLGLGPHITSVNISSDGITRYSMRSYAKRADTSVDRELKRASELNSMARQVKLLALDNKKSKLRRERIQAKKESDRRYNDRGAVQSTNSKPVAVLIGETKKYNHGNPETPEDCGFLPCDPDITDFAADPKWTRPNVISEHIEGVSYEMQNNFNNKAFMSQDGFFRPVSMDGDGGFNPLAEYTQHEPDDPCNVGELVEAAQTCSVDLTGTPILNIVHQDALLALTNPSSVGVRSFLTDKHSNIEAPGHDVDIVGRSVEDDGDMVAPPEGLCMNRPLECSKKDYTADYRYMALKGPLEVVGWGHDTDGYPIPNAIDDPVAASNGMFEDGSGDPLECDFIEDWLHKSETWVHAPVDLRYDRKSGTWVSPCVLSKWDFITGVACENIPGGTTGTVRITYPTNIRDCEGEIVSPAAGVDVENKTGCDIEKNDIVIARKMHDGCYWILQATCSGDGEPPEICIVDECVAANNMVAGVCVPFEQLVFGQGLVVDYDSITDIAKIGAGLEAEIDEGCEEFPFPPPLIAPGLINKLKFRKGLQVRRENCDLIIDTYFFVRNQDSDEVFSPRGIRFECAEVSVDIGTGSEECVALVKPQMLATPSELCYDNDLPMATKWNNLHIGKGLAKTEITQNNVGISLALDVNGNEVSKLDFSTCFDVTAGDCESTVDLNMDHYAPNDKTVVTDVTFNPVTCELILTTSTMQFTECGLYIGSV